MCEIKTRAGTPCAKVTRFYVSVDTIPQPLGPDGVYGHEGANAARSLTTCRLHLAVGVDQLAELPIRRYGADVRVVVYAPPSYPRPALPAPVSTSAPVPTYGGRCEGDHA